MPNAHHALRRTGAQTSQAASPAHSPAPSRPRPQVDWEWLCAARAQAHASPLEELISNAGSEADEVVSVSASPEGGQWGGSQRHPPGAGFGASSSGGDGSRLSALLADTPRAKLDAKEAEAKAASKAGSCKGPHAHA